MSRNVDRFNGVRAKVERAEFHLAELAAMDREFSSVECSLAINQDAKSGVSHFSLTIPTPPSTVPMIAGDLLNNLRSSLDHLIWQIVASNNEGQPSRENMFPICTTEKAFSDQIKRNRLRGVPQNAIEQIERLQPFIGEHNSPLGLLNDLCNKDKHQDIHYCVSIASDVFLVASRNGAQVFTLTVENDEIRNGEIFGGIGFQPDLLHGVDFEIKGCANAHISFRDLQSEPDETLPLTRTLREMVEYVKYEVIDSLRTYVSHGSA